MNLLALDTSTDACSVALTVDATTDLRHVVEPRAHTRILMPMIRELLESQGLRATDLDAIVLGNGPGSFIGVRIATSVAQGLAFAAGLRVAVVSSLEAIAAEVFATTTASKAIVTQDARMHEVYLGQYERGSDDLPLPLGEIEMHSADEAPAPAEGTGVAYAGGGWHRYPSLAGGLAGGAEWFEELRCPRADYLLRCGEAKISVGDLIAAEDVVPAYVRSKVASVPTRA